MDRPDWTHYYLGMAKTASVRGACTRRQIGAIVEHEHHVYGTGYNGTPRGSSLSCLDGDCPRGRHKPHTVIVYKPTVEKVNPNQWNIAWDGSPYKGGGGTPTEVEVCSWDGRNWPCPDSVQPGSDYNRGPGKCISIHAEMNALIDALRHGLPPGGTLYCSDAPCDDCIRFMTACQIKYYYYLTDPEKMEFAGPIGL